MANEAVNSEKPRVIKRASISDVHAIAKGTILQLSGADLISEASNAVAAGAIFSGITVEEKTANDGITEVGAAIDGVWELKVNASDGVTLGSMVCLSGANLIRDAIEADFPLGRPFGKALESGAASEVIRVRLGLN